MIYMIQLDQMKLELQQYEAPMEEVRDSLDLDYKKQRIEELQRESEAPDFWMNADKANQKMKQLKDLQTTVEDADGLVNSYEEIMMMIEMGNEEEDESVVEEVRADLDAFEAKIEEMRLATLLTGEYDDSNAIISLNAGAGGTESCDWCSMLYRMYTKWADKKGFTIDVMNYVDGDEAGIKSVDFQINGTNAYGYLKSERGVHRLVRISPFNAQGKRQTSFVSCDVMPDIEKDIDIVINPDDIRIDTYRSSGAGGQHINKTSSAIRITHFPTGDAQGQTLHAQKGRGRGQAGGHPGRGQGHRLGKPDPVLCPPAIYYGQGYQDPGGDIQRGRRPERRPGPLHQRLPEDAGRQSRET